MHHENEVGEKRAFAAVDSGRTCSDHGIDDGRVQPVETERKKDYSVLTEQQKAILTKEDMPLDYDQLSIQQQVYLEHCDGMLTYANEKYEPYGVTFEYDEYHPAELMEGAWISVNVVGGDPETDYMVVHRSRKGEYSDNYLELAVRPVYEEILTDYFTEQLGENQVKVFSSTVELDSIKTEDLADLSKQRIFEAAQEDSLGTTVSLYISESGCSAADFPAVIDAYCAWLIKNQFLGRQYVFLIPADGMSKVSREDGADPIHDQVILRSYPYISDDHVVGGEIEEGYW